MLRLEPSPSHDLDELESQGHGGVGLRGCLGEWGGYEPQLWERV